MPKINFAKMQGIGNDFVVVDEDAIAGHDPAYLAQMLCDRHTGVGSDGLLIVGKAKSPSAYSFRMHNPDGSPDMCGNGMRCALLYAHKTGLVDQLNHDYLIETIDGLLTGRLESVSGDGRSANVTVQMAIPKFGLADIPYTGSPETGTNGDLSITLSGQTIQFTPVNTGSAHAVVIGEELPSEDFYQLISPQFEIALVFPEKISVMWTKQIGENEFQIRTWERAAGETLGCGTGACAVAVVAIAKRLADRTKPVAVRSKGGVLNISWSSDASSVSLNGPAVWVFEGEAAL